MIVSARVPDDAIEQPRRVGHRDVARLRARRRDASRMPGDGARTSALATTHAGRSTCFRIRPSTRSRRPAAAANRRSRRFPRRRAMRARGRTARLRWRDARLPRAAPSRAPGGVRSRQSEQSVRTSSLSTRPAVATSLRAPRACGRVSARPSCAQPRPDSPRRRPSFRFLSRRRRRPLCRRRTDSPWG